MSQRRPFEWTTSSPSSIPGDHLFDEMPELRALRRSLNYLTTLLTNDLTLAEYMKGHCSEASLPVVTDFYEDVKHRLEAVKETHLQCVNTLADRQRDRGDDE
jgi:hypothetical protein